MKRRWMGAIKPMQLMALDNVHCDLSGAEPLSPD